MYFQLGGCAKAEAFLALLHHCLAHRRVVVTHKHGAPGQDVVDIALALAVKDIGTLAALDKYRGAAHGFEGAHGRIDTAGDVLFGAFEQLF